VLPAVLEVADLLYLGEHRLMLLAVRVELPVSGELHQQLLAPEVCLAEARKLLEKLSGQPRPPAFERVHESAHERHLEMVLPVEGIVAKVQPVAPGMRLFHATSKRMLTPCRDKQRAVNAR